MDELGIKYEVMELDQRDDGQDIQVRGVRLGEGCAGGRSRENEGASESPGAGN
jgi:hypothetical protein